MIRKTLLEGCRSHANIFFGTTLLTNFDFRFVYDAFYQAILLEWTIVGVSAVTVIIAVRCWCCSYRAVPSRRIIQHDGRLLCSLLPESNCDCC